MEYRNLGMDKDIFTTKWFSIKEIENKNNPDEPFYGVKPPDYVTAIAYDEKNSIILIEQFRPIINRYCLETPGGQVDKGYTAIETIKQELIEETGYNFKDINQIALLEPDVGRLMNKLYIFEAKNPISISSEIEEGIIIKKYSVKEVLTLLKNGYINNAYSIAALSLSITIHG